MCTTPSQTYWRATSSVLGGSKPPAMAGAEAAGDSGGTPACGDGVVQGREVCDPPDGVSCDSTCQYIPPAEWTCPGAYYGDGDYCDCGCGAHDLDCQSDGIGACNFCDSPGACQSDDCPGEIDPDDNAQCL